MRTVLLPILSLALVAGCHRAPADNASAAAAASFVPPPTQKATPLPGLAQSNPITAYVGRYPRDAVDGVSFYDRTEVANALIDAVPDEKTRRLYTGRDAVTGPIFRQGARVAAWGCEPHNCSDRNWTFLVEPDGSAGEACYHDGATMAATSRWYRGGGAKPMTRPGACPQA